MKRIVAAVLACLLLKGTVAAALPAQQPADPRLDQRVTIRFENATAPEVLSEIGHATTGLQFRFDTQLATSRVTITLTNVRVRTALDAVCENAQCRWTFLSTDIIQFSYEEGAPPIPATIALRLNHVPLRDAIQAVADAMGVKLIVENGRLPDQLSNWNLDAADSRKTLKLLGALAGCSVDLDEQARTLRFCAENAERMYVPRR